MKRLLWVGLGIAILWAIFAPALFAAEETVVSSPGLLISINPCRLVDTRGPAGEYGGPNLSAGFPGATRTFTATGQCGIPAGALAISANFTLDNLDTEPSFISYPRGQSKYGDLRVWPTGGAKPFVSLENWTLLTGVVANATVVPLSPGGQISASIDGFGVYGADLIVDVWGYYVEGALKGEAGPKGDKGDKGDQGIPGVNATPSIGGIASCGTTSAPLPAWAKCSSAVTDARIKVGMVFGSSYLTRTADDQIPVRIFNIHAGGFSYEIQTGTSFMWYGGAP